MAKVTVPELAHAPQSIKLLAALAQPVKVLLAERFETGVDAPTSRGCVLRASPHRRRRGGWVTTARALALYPTLNRRAQHDVARGIAEGQTQGVCLHAKHQAAGIDRHWLTRPY